MNNIKTYDLFYNENNLFINNIILYITIKFNLLIIILVNKKTPNINNYIITYDLFNYEIKRLKFNGIANNKKYSKDIYDKYTIYEFYKKFKNICFSIFNELKEYKNNTKIKNNEQIAFLYLKELLLKIPEIKKYNQINNFNL